MSFIKYALLIGQYNSIIPFV